MAIRSTSIRDTISVVLLETPTQRESRVAASRWRWKCRDAPDTPLRRYVYISADGYTSKYIYCLLCLFLGFFFFFSFVQPKQWLMCTALAGWLMYIHLTVWLYWWVIPYPSALFQFLFLLPPVLCCWCLYTRDDMSRRGTNTTTAHHLYLCVDCTWWFVYANRRTVCIWTCWRRRRLLLPRDDASFIHLLILSFIIV